MSNAPTLRGRKRDLAAEIAQAIGMRAYRPGEWLRQIDLEETFRATRFDVRRALEELVVRKTIEHVPNRGYRVALIDHATARAIRETRIILEVPAAVAAVDRLDEAALTRLESLAARFSEAVRSGTRLEQSEINSAFHHLIYAHCGNPVLEETIWSLRDRSRGSAVTVWNSHESLLDSDREHHAMVEAIRLADRPRLAGLTARHIGKDMAERARGPGQDGGAQLRIETSQSRGSEVSEET